MKNKTEKKIKMHPDTESVYWMMLCELESNCEGFSGEKSIIEAGYRHWNRTHGTNLKPYWIKDKV